MNIPINISLDDIAAKRRRISYLRARDWEFGVELIAQLLPPGELREIARKSIQDRERSFSYHDLQQLDITGSLEATLGFAEEVVGTRFPWDINSRGPDETRARSDAPFIATIDAPGLFAGGSGWTACAAILDALFVVLEAGHPETVDRLQEGNGISDADFETTAPWAEITEGHGR